VKRVVEEGVCSERRACRYLGLHRSSCQYRALEETRVVIEEWRAFYNRVHPHSGLGFQSPDGFARTMAPLKPVPGT
jgi:transposase InsO family protein